METKPHNADPAAHSPEQSAKVHETLERVLASHAFRKSEQCQKFLRYVVEHSDSSRDDLLKERIIGVEVFGRQTDYDTADDPAVRVRAAEVRNPRFAGADPSRTVARRDLSRVGGAGEGAED